MTRSIHAIAFAIAASATLAAPVAWSQKASPAALAGTWMLVSNVNTKTDGTKADVFGSNPKGILIFTPDGHFAVVNTRADLPKFASGNRMTGTAEENKAVVQGSIALYGRYTVKPDGSLGFDITSSTWPAWSGTQQARKYTLKGDELKWTLAASVGGTADLTWKRVK